MNNFSTFYEFKKTQIRVFNSNLPKPKMDRSGFRIDFPSLFKLNIN